MTYERITADHPGALMVAHTLAGGGFACDAVHHNRESGCDNPKCFNYWPPKDAVVREVLAEIQS